MKDLDVVNQSKAAYGQWCKQWRKNASHHARYKMNDLLDFQNIGVGKAVLVIANGYSFEQQIETIKKYQGNVDIMCVDKCLVKCIEHGIKPTYCLVCDANVSYETYMKPVEDQLQDTYLIANVCGATDWADHGNWKERYFFVNKDVLKSEDEFIKLSGCQNIIPAGTNVSNAAIVMLTQCDEHGRKNFFGYDKLLMIGFDYCWTDQSYYAFDKTGSGKSNYMKSIYAINAAGQMVYTSPNLLFSAKWLEKYIKVFSITAVQCSRSAIVLGAALGDLGEQMQYRYKPEDANEVRSLLEYRRQLTAKTEEINRRINAIGRDHFKQLKRTM